MEQPTQHPCPSPESVSTSQRFCCFLVSTPTSTCLSVSEPEDSLSEPCHSRPRPATLLMVEPCWSARGTERFAVKSVGSHVRDDPLMLPWSLAATSCAWGAE